MFSELPLSSVIPEKASPYLLSPNISIFTQLESIVAHNDQLMASASIEWTEMDTLPSGADSSADENAHSNASLAMAQPMVQNDAFDRGRITQGQESHSDVDGNGAGKNAINERMQVWVEDRLLNELMEHFRWDFVWMEEVGGKFLSLSK